MVPWLANLYHKLGRSDPPSPVALEDLLARLKAQNPVAVRSWGRDHPNILWPWDVLTDRLNVAAVKACPKTVGSLRFIGLTEREFRSASDCELAHSRLRTLTPMERALLNNDLARVEAWTGGDSGLWFDRTWASTLGQLLKQSTNPVPWLRWCDERWGASWPERIWPEIWPDSLKDWLQPDCARQWLDHRCADRMWATLPDPRKSVRKRL